MPDECKFGEKCYRKNEDHLKESHPEKLSKENEETKESPEKVAKKRKMAIHVDEEEVVEENKEAKIRRKENEEVDKEDEVVEVVEEFEEVYDEDEDDTEEEIVHAGRRVQERSYQSSSNFSSHSSSNLPHRSPFCPQPPSIYSLWKKAMELEPDNPRDAFSEVNGLRLVGFFDFLAGDLKDATDDEIRIHARYATDLPEMQTIMVTNSGRYALWRDDPKHATVMIVHVKDGDDHFTKITMVGDKPIHALVHAAGDGADAMLSKFYPSSTYKYATMGSLRQDAKTVIARRTKNSLGRPLHTMRLWVHVDDNNVGYRSLGEDLNKLKRTMTMIGETTDDVVRKKKMAELREMGTNVQLALDECDFGTSLEWGHDLFIANYPQLDPMAMRYLKMSYQFLCREEFIAVVDAHMADGVRRRNNVMIN